MSVATDKDLRALLRQIEICARFGLGWVVAHYEVHRHDVDCISHRLKNTREIARRKHFSERANSPGPKSGKTPQYKELYTHTRSFMMRIDGRVEGICPGCPQRP